MMSRLTLVIAVAVASIIAACSSDATDADTAAQAPECSSKIERFKELALVDDAIVEDARSRNATAGVWSFRHAVEQMAPEGTEPGRFVYDWLREWQTRKTLNGEPLDREPRDSEMNSIIICPWLKRTPANACDEACTACADHKLDLALAPFRLRAIMNRMDLREDANATGPAGEGRLLFALTEGAADDPASRVLPMSIIFEYTLPETLPPHEWAKKWHSLGKHADFDEAYRAELETVTETFVRRNANPTAKNGSAISQVRTNESALNWIWQLREFKLDASGSLTLSTVKQTPAESFNGTDELVRVIRENSDKVLSNKFVVPEYMLGGSIDLFLFRWNLPGLDDATRLAFSKNTCNGCHAENQMIDTAFHVSPFRKGTDKLSPFLYNREKPETDELTKRTESLHRALCAQ